MRIDPGVEALCVRSDDGSKLYLDDVLIADNDGLHVSVRVCGNVSMGTYQLDLEYIEAGGGALLILEWRVAAGSFMTVLPSSFLWYMNMHCGFLLDTNTVIVIVYIVSSLYHRDYLR